MEWTVQFNLGKATSLFGLYLNIYWTVIDAAGSGNAYLAKAVATQSDVSCDNPQVCGGITSSTASNVMTIGKFTK